MKEVWNLKDIFQSEQEWSCAKIEMNSYLEKVLAYEGRLEESSTICATGMSFS